ncbi:MAG: metallophosphoesterase [Halobacteriota archaeon]|nr:metallophosphoesterase [Halobacteriota archaeon]
MKRYLVIADIHGSVSAVEGLIRTIDSGKHDAVLIAGDIPITTPPRLILEYILRHKNLNRGGYSEWVYDPTEKRSQFLNYQLKSSDRILNKLKEQKLPVFYTPGNVDCSEVLDFIRSEHPDVNLARDTKLKIEDGTSLVGISGAIERFGRPICDGDLTEEMMDSKVERIREIIDPEESTILLAHEPPRFKIVSGRRNGLLRGSRAITELIKKVSPLFVVCAHFHEHAGVYSLNGIPVINPGSLATYRYAEISFSKEENKIECELRKVKRPMLDPIGSIYTYREHFGESIEMID